MTIETILIVEDDIDVRYAFANAMDLEGYTVFEARHGADALRKVKRIKGPAILVVDLMMPVMSGWEFIAAIDEQGLALTWPTVVFTADGVNAKFNRRVRFIKKPASIEEILLVMKEEGS